MPVQIDLSELCVQVQEGRQLCLSFPGGAQICTQIGVDLGDPGAITRSFLGEINTALAPMVPLFSVLDVVLALVECVQAIPDAVSVPPDPTKLFQCVPTLLEKVAKVLSIPLQVPVMLKQIITAIVESVLVILSDLEAFARYELDLLAAATAAAQPGNAVLQAIYDCERSNFDVEVANLSASMQPINRLIGVVNLVMEPIIGQTIPTFADLGGSPAEAIQPIRNTLEIIQQVASLLPG